MRKDLQQARKAKALSMQDMADVIGVTKSAYGNIEAGRRNPSVSVAIRIAQFLDKPVEYLFR